MSYATMGKIVMPHNPMATTPIIPTGTYSLNFSMEMGFHLSRTDNFDINHKVYGKNTGIAERIWNTFCAKKRLGVLLSGDKGSGKTLVTKQVASMAIDNEIPVILVNTPYYGDGFNNFLNNIRQQCVVLFDEFEKVYDEEQQEKLLTVLDGTLTSDKLYLFTCNDLGKIQNHLMNRPGRIHYHYRYKGVTEDLIRDYCQEKLNDKTQIDKVVLFSEQFKSFNFDLLQTVVSEMNLYNENVYEVSLHLNATPDNLYIAGNYTVVKLTHKGKDKTADVVAPFLNRPSILRQSDMSIAYKLKAKGKDKDSEDHDYAYFNGGVTTVTLDKDTGHFKITDVNSESEMIIEQAFKDPEKAAQDHMKYILTV